MAATSRLRSLPLHHRGPAGRPVWRHHGLIGQFVRREVQSRYRGSVLGLLWSVLNPLLLLGVYTFVFGSIFRARWPLANSGRLSDIALVIFCGLLVLNLFTECVSRAPGLIVGQPSYVKKIVFPLEILPVVALGSALFNAAIALGVVIAANLALERLRELDGRARAPGVPAGRSPGAGGRPGCLQPGRLPARPPLRRRPALADTPFPDADLLSDGSGARLGAADPGPQPADPRPWRASVRSCSGACSRTGGGWRCPSWLAIVVLILGHSWFMKTKRAFADVV